MAAGLAAAGIGCSIPAAGVEVATPLPQSATAAAPAQTPTADSTARDYLLVGYYASWNVYSRAAFLSRIRGERLTHLNYAFADVTPEGECALGDGEADTMRFFDSRESVDGQADPAEGLRGNFRQLQLLKEKYPGLQVLISIGGWTFSGNFSAAARTHQSRERLVRSCLDLFLVRYGEAFDGVDLDWEYPVGGGLHAGLPEDRDNYSLLIREFRNQLDALGQAAGRRYLLTIAGPSVPSVISHFELGRIHPDLDWINLMAYDFHVASEPSTGLLSPLYGSPRDPDSNSRKSYNADAAAGAYLAAGVPPEKIVLGIPFYGRSWQTAGGDGLFQPAGGPAPGPEESGYLSYADIARGPMLTFRRYWEDNAKVPWLYDPESGIFISYEDAESVGWKADYIRERGLGGAMVWELGLDGGALIGPLGEDLYAGG
ncbi:MAG: glycoside hydrolase family 18 protein [Anaerolineales bacterium]|nr:glycoside hydrolase family 18 protein [Anaerolineales bacterium]